MQNWLDLRRVRCNFSSTIPQSIEENNIKFNVYSVFSKVLRFLVTRTPPPQINVLGITAFNLGNNDYF